LNRVLKENLCGSGASPRSRACVCSAAPSPASQTSIVERQGYNSLGRFAPIGSAEPGRPEYRRVLTTIGWYSVGVVNKL
jgi:hypothetical protein